MFDLWCRTCGRTYLVGTRRLLSLHNTSRGPLGCARCPEGHLTVVAFHGVRTHDVESPPGSAA